MEENNVENEEVKEIEEGNNGIKIANDVISVIAGVAVSEVPGVASMAGGFAGGITEVLSGKKNLSKGIKVDADEKEVRIDVNIIVEYGSRIPDVAYEIQTRVKKSVENMTGLKVSEVNVHVQGVKTEKEVEEKEENEEDKIDVSQEFKPMTAEDNVSVFEGESSYATKPVYKYIGIAFNTYIIIEMKSDLYIIDQHAAHERIMYEKIRQNYYNNDTKDSQLMLLPDIITLTHKEMGIYRDNKELFQRAGFMVEEFGENTVKLSGVPDVLLDLETKELFLETLDEINTVARTAKQEIEEKFIATVACKAAVKAHMVLERQEVIQLLDKLLQLPNPFTCPHGRPTAIKMTRNDIEKKFSRR